MTRALARRAARWLAVASLAGAGIFGFGIVGFGMACASTGPRPGPVASEATPAEPEAPVAVEPPPAPAPDDGGWTYLIDKLVADGVPRERAEKAFRDPRFGAFDGLYFRTHPREPRSMYRHFLGGSSVARLKSCRAEHAAAFERAAQAHQVPASVIASILHVETGCGSNTGDELVLYGLARLAMANEPTNLEENVVRNATVKGVRDPELERKTRARGKYLEDLFYPEVRATFEVADRLGLDPLELRGSGSGAFGYPQFLPTSYLRYGADGNGDGAISLYDVDDAAASAGRYLAHFGWKPGLSHEEKRRVIWHYNRSDAYIDTVLSLAGRLDAPPKAAGKPKPSKKKPTPQLAAEPH